VVAVACLFTWYWLAGLWAHEGLPLVLGQALSMQAIYGGKATHDTIDAPKMAARLRGRMLPQASGYPAQMRATGDLLRRRTPLMRTRAELLAHGQHPNSPDHRPELGKNIADTANRDGVAERVHAAAVPKPIEVDLALITSDDARLQDLDLSIVNTAKPHAAHPLYRLQTIPGLGKSLSLVWRYDMHQLDRVPRVPDCASYGRLVKCRKEAGGKRLGPSGKTIGQAPLTWAFSEAATLCLRHNPQGQQLLSRLEKKHDTGKALSILAHQRGRAVYCLRKRNTAFDRPLFLRSSGSRAGEPGASLAAYGLRLKRARAMSNLTASGNAKVGRGPVSLRPGA
jgi:hypothetical protein